jgi:hypothetical protein
MGFSSTEILQKIFPHGFYYGRIKKDEIQGKKNVRLEL